MRLRQFLAAAGIALVAALSSAPGEAGSLDDIIARGSVKIGVDLSVPPFGVTNEKGEPDGLDVEFAKLLAKDLGVKLDLVQVTGQSRIPSLVTGKVDFVVASFGIYVERAKSIAFSNPYGGHQSVIVAPKGTKIEKMSDLAGKRVGVPRGTAHEKVLSEAGIKDMRLIRFDDDSSTLNALVSGQVDAIGTVNYIAAELKSRFPDRGFEEKFTYLKSFYGVGLRRNEPDLLHWLNTVIFVHNQSGELAAIYEKWMKAPLPALPSF